MSDVQLTLAEYRPVSPMIFAFKIASIVQLDDGKTVLEPEGDKNFLALIVNEEFTNKFHPQTGDYFVASAKGGQAILSAEIFECPNFGFAPIEKGQPQ